MAAGLIAASVGLGFWFAEVNTACEKPYRDGLGTIISGSSACNFSSPHADQFLGELVLIVLTIVAGLAGLTLLAVSLMALFSKEETPQERRVAFEAKVAETKARDAAREAAAQRQQQEQIRSAARELASAVAPIRLPRLGLVVHDGMLYEDNRPLGSLAGSHATFTKLPDRPTPQHGLAYQVVIGLQSGPAPRGAVTVMIEGTTYRREAVGAMAVRQIHAEADRLNLLAAASAT